MQQNFLPDESESSSADISVEVSTDPVSGKEFVKILAIGSRKAVTTVIKTLHRLRFAEVGAWSPLVPYGDSGEMMSVLRKPVSLE